MGYKRQQARIVRNRDGEFAEKESQFEVLRNAKLRGFAVRIYYVNRESGCVRKEWIGGTAAIEGRIARFSERHPQCRIRLVNRSWSGPRWQKPEHPIAFRRRMRELQRQQAMGNN